VRQHGTRRYSRRLLACTLGAAALAGALLTAGLPGSAALASPRAAGSTSYSFFVSRQVKALGHTWTFSLGASKESGVDLIDAGLETVHKGIIEVHGWDSTTAFSSTVAKDFRVTSAGHATIKTGSALRPVLAATLAFTPTRQTKEACAKGSERNYSGKVTGTLSLTTGLRGVKLSATFTGKTTDASLSIDRSCVPRTKPSKTPCSGGFWTVAATPLTTGGVIGGETLAAKPFWQNSFFRENLRTASKWLTRTDDLFVNAHAPAPKLNKKAHTVSVTESASGPITGAAVITYGPVNTPLRIPSCYVGRKHYSEKLVSYTGTKVTVSKPFKARMVLTGTQTMVVGRNAEYIAVSLKAR
jgi:hypothetical protein